MQIHPLVTVKKAATALGVDKEVIRNMIDIGAVRAERRFIKNKERWFLYQEEVQEYLDKRALELSDQATRTTMEGLGEFFDPEGEVSVPVNDDDDDADAAPPESESIVVTEVGENEADHPDRNYLQTTQNTLDQMLHSLTIEFAHRLCEERQIICNLKQQLDERNQLLADIPDLRQMLDEVKSLQQSRDAEIALLKANITALESDLSQRKQPWWSRLFAGAQKA